MISMRNAFWVFSLIFPKSRPALAPANSSYTSFFFFRSLLFEATQPFFAQNMITYGRTCCGWSANDFYRPSIKEFGADIDKARSDNRNPPTSVPTPCGWNFDVVQGQLSIDPGADEFPDYKAAYGFVASINEASCNDTDAPLSCQIIVRLPFKYGFKAEEYRRSFGYTRVIAFTSKCVCADPPPYFSLY